VLDVVDHHYIYGAVRRFYFQPELFFEGHEDRWGDLLGSAAREFTE
jgi:hypothetical protein